MMINRFELVNFRGIKKMPLSFKARTTALVGINGVGKSTALDALAISLSNLTSRICSQPAKSRQMSPDDIQVGTDYARLIVEADLQVNSSATIWAVALNRRSGKHDAERSSDLAQLNDHSGLFEGRLGVSERDSTPVELPLAVYYDVHRAVLDVPLRVREKVRDNARGAYEDALGHGGTDFKRFFIWFRDREDQENEQIRDNPNYRDRDLSAVRKAIEGFTKFSDLRIRRRPLRMTLKKEGTELNVMQLSDGEKCMLALVGDLARRLSQLNTALPDPLEGRGVVLIDEIDLHLHPRWQRTVVAQLEATFPNCQFIVSTHSPQVLGELPAESVLLLKDGRCLGHPERAFGLSSGEVLEELMDSQAMDATVSEELKVIERHIDDDEIGVAQSLLDGLKMKVGLIPRVSEAQSAIDSLKWLEDTKE